MNLAAVVFDLDGTLVDSRPDIATAVNRIRSELGLAALSLAEVGGMMGEGSRNLVRRALAQGLPEMAAMDADRFERSHSRFLEHYARVCTAETRAYEGVDLLLDACARRWPLALLTNKPIAMTRALIEALDWGRFFRVVIGGDSLPYRKPDGRGLLAVAAALGSAAETTLLVGDSRIDAETARAAGTQFVWVEWGYAPEQDRSGLANGPCVASPAALLRYLEALPQ